MSKSKKQRSSGSHGKGQHPAQKHGHAHEHEHAPEHGHEHDDDLIIVPKGQSRLKFFGLLGLTIFLLIMFVVPGALFSTATGSGRSEIVYAAWTRDDGTRVEINGSDFVLAKRELRVLERLLPALGMGGMDLGEDPDTIRFLLQEDVALQAGIRVSDGDLAAAILGLFGSTETYRAQLQTAFSYVTPAAFERALRRALVVQRLRVLLSAAAGGVAPSEIEEVWKANHQEYAFDYVQLDTAQFADAALAQVPGDEELEAWFDGLSGFAKAAYNTELAWSAELAYAPLSDDPESWDFDPTALLAAYPRPEDEDLDAKALDYYNRVRFTRFRRAEPLEDPEDPDRLVLPFEEVEALALREAPVYFALEEWQRALAARMTDGSLVGAVDLAAEAAAAGLQHVPAEEPRTLTAWTEDEGHPWSGTRLPSMLRNLQPGQVTAALSVEPGAMVVGQLAERKEPGLPPFAEVRDQVAEAWAKEQRGELAREALAAVRDGLGEPPAPPEPDPETGEVPEPEPFTPKVELEAFRAACQAVGYEVQRRDYEERSFRAPAPGVEEEPVQAFLRFNPSMYVLEEGEVQEALLDNSGEHAFLVRAAGVRDADLSKMKPGEYWRNYGTLANQGASEFFASTLDDLDYLRERYGLFLYDTETEPEPAGA